MPLVEHLRQPNGDIVERPFMHTVFLIAGNADLPGQKKISHSNGVSAYVSCETCLFQSTRYMHK